MQLFIFSFVLCLMAQLCLAQPTESPAPIWQRDATNLPVSPALPRSDSAGSGLELNSNTETLLKADQAFILSADSPNRQQIVLRWYIAPGYYLYHDKFKFNLQKGALGTPQLPPHHTKEDPLFGRVEVYEPPELKILLPLMPLENADAVELNITYQGCATGRLCYPPIEKTLTIRLGEPQLSSEQDDIVVTLTRHPPLYTLLVFFGFGILLSLTPCVLPMLPILSSLVVGQGTITTGRAFLISLTYVLAMAFTYAAAGVLAGLLGANLQAVFQTPWVIVGFAVIFVLLALSMFGFYELRLPNTWHTRLHEWSGKQRGGEFVGVVIMGVFSALIVSPCVTAPLVGTLMYISQTGHALFGGMALFSMGLGMGALLLLVGTSAGRLIPKAGVWMNTVKAVFGVLLLAVALWLLERLLSPTVTVFLSASLLIISAVFMGALDSLEATASGWQRLWKGTGLIVLIYGIFLLISAASGHSNWLHPLSAFAKGATSVVTPLSTFKHIKGLEALDRELVAAQGKPVLVDVYADWCISCKELEHFTLSDPRVQALLANWVLLRLDVTTNDAADKAVYQRFELFGPPVLLFFTPAGQEQKPARIVGFLSADKLTAHLQRWFRNVTSS